MNYPLITEYIESIRYAYDHFANLTNLRSVLDEDGYHRVYIWFNMPIKFNLPPDSTKTKINFLQ